MLGRSKAPRPGLMEGCPLGNAVEAEAQGAEGSALYLQLGAAAEPPWAQERRRAPGGARAAWRFQFLGGAQEEGGGKQGGPVGRGRGGRGGSGGQAAPEGGVQLWSSRPLCAAHRRRESQGGLPASPSGAALPASTQTPPSCRMLRAGAVLGLGRPRCKAWLAKDLLINLLINECPSSSHRGFKAIHKNSYNTVITK